MNLWLELLIVTVSLGILTILAGLSGMPLLRKLQVGQTVRDDGPKTHYKKSGTPTFGGFFFLLPLLIFAVLLNIFFADFSLVAIVLAFMLLFAFAGFLDDYIKVRISKKGLSVKQKTIMLGLFSIIFTAYYLYFASVEPFLLLPFSSEPVMITGWYKLPYGLLVVLYLFFVSNSVNLTDGVDGLASTVSAICAVMLGITAAGLEHLTSDSHAVRLAAFAIAGGCLGFLAFNWHPARVFMGDTGSQALGAGLAGIALLMGVPWLIAIAGVIYMTESFSVMIQVAYFKKTGGKRIFRMSPIHHHFELGGWSELKIVAVFAFVTLLGGIVGLLMLLPAVKFK